MYHKIQTYIGPERPSTHCWDTTFQSYGTLKVLSIEYIDTNDDHVYDIEVFGTHTMICCNNDGSIGICSSNCHHMAAQVFSQALKKVNFKYSIGLSATPKRKDGLTKVFTWFLGDIAFKTQKRRDTLHVKLLEYYTPDPAYSREHTLYSKKPNISKMINSICEYGPRVEFLIRELVHILKHEPARRVLILSDRRQHLHIMKDHLDAKKIESGFYYGGLSAVQLKESENKQVLLATYQYASEGFDMKGLNTLILSSPKSDVIQVVGRILRDKPEDRTYTPLVVDIVDDFSIFPNQAKKRLAYYKSCKYKIDAECPAVCDVKKIDYPKGQYMFKEECN